MSHSHATATTRQTRRLYRGSDGQLVAGVCRGLSEHLGIDVVVVRLAFVVLTFVGAAGVVMYAAFWVFAPLADNPEAANERSSRQEVAYVVALASLAAGALLLGRSIGWQSSTAFVWPLAVIAVGVVLLWQQADDAQRARWRAATTGEDRGVGILRAALGLALFVIGVLAFVSRGGGVDASIGVLFSALVIGAGLAVISAPWWMRMARDLAAERSARIREQERAEVAAHVHDSVLHTLTLIQRNIDDPREVARLARAQERELRTWLYRPVADPDTTLTAALERAVADVEDAHGVKVELVTVGDCPLDDPLRATLLATREALVNAAKYAAEAPISLFAEAEADRVTVFVRDRGPGFDVDGVPEDRLGVRQSIIGRMRRNGGSAVVRSRLEEGTEVQLEMPRGSQGRGAQ